ncbi:hypothetical protein [Pontibacter sp. G13]|uniref:type II secretion system protein GspD n=1 Tax=Pontibacter sp. G13 TaxID=3074898 RepID=UPI002889B4ED|nr:hypothetical protein [Pontibacter sp. G13]WNJ21613.1 hypothetical protein RJD25_28850 [Pontibacter sp. G13]
MNRYLLVISIMCWLGNPLLQAQRPQIPPAEVSIFLDSLSQHIPQLGDTTRLSLHHVQVSAYIRAIGQAHGISVYLADTPDQLVTSTLVGEPVATVFAFVCKTFGYTLETTGGILQFIPYTPPAPPPSVPHVRALDIRYASGKLACDLRNDSLHAVIRTLSALTGRNILTQPGTQGLLTAYLPPTPLDTALEALFLSNGYVLQPREKGYYLVQDLFVEPTTNNRPKPRGRLDFEVASLTDGQISYLDISASQSDLDALLKEIFRKTGNDYLFYGELAGKITLETSLTPLDELLGILLQGTSYTFRKQQGIYLLGPQSLEGLNTCEVVTLKYRPTHQALDLIPGATDQMEGRTPAINGRTPAPRSIQTSTGFPSHPSTHSLGTSPPPDIRKIQIRDVELVEYPELNRIILQGPTQQVSALKAFLAEVDRPVPMIRVDMVVVEVNRDKLIQTGIQAGLSSRANGDTTSGSILPGIDYRWNPRELNAILGSVPALRPLGLLDERFYLRLHAQESRGNLKVRMQPVLSMLNGREATLTIGQTQYFLLESQSQGTGTVNNFQQTTQRFEQIEANVTLTMRPYVADDGMVTLEVAPDFTTPVGGFSPDVPPTIATRRFVSTIRVQTGETVVLGGLTEESLSETHQGIPWLSRVPILKWLTGNRQKNRQHSSLLIYLTPTVYYH